MKKSMEFVKIGNTNYWKANKIELETVYIRNADSSNRSNGKKIIWRFLSFKQIATTEVADNVFSETITISFLEHQSNLNALNDIQ